MLDPCQNTQLLLEMGLSEDAANAFLKDYGNKYYDAKDPDLPSPFSSTENSNGFGKIAPSTIKSLFSEETSHPPVNSSTAAPLSFTAFIQYVDYAGFATAMESLRGKKLIYAPEGKNNADQPKVFSAEVKVTPSLFLSPLNSLHHFSFLTITTNCGAVTFFLKLKRLLL